MLTAIGTLVPPGSPASAVLPILTRFGFQCRDAASIAPAVFEEAVRSGRAAGSPEALNPPSVYCQRDDPGAFVVRADARWIAHIALSNGVVRALAVEVWWVSL